MSQHRYSRKIETREPVDVFVAGGGPAGIAAAIIAARQGRSVFLAEYQICLGGMGTAGMLPIFMQFGDGVNFYAGGFGRELYDRMLAEGATLPVPERPWGKMLPTIRAEVLKRVYDDLAEAAGVKISLMTQVIDVEQSHGHVSHVICAAKSGVFAVPAKIVIDGTGDGDVCAWAGAPFDKGDADGNLMGGTLCSLWAKIDWEKVFAAKQNPETTLIACLRENPDILPQTDPHLPGIIKVSSGIGGGNVGHSYGVDGTDEQSLTRAIIWGRKLLPHYERFYKEHLQGFAEMELVGSASQFGIRETRRIRGDYELNYNDYLKNAVFPDEIGRYQYWIDTHLSNPSLDEFEEHRKKRSSTKKPGESYGIPYRALTPQTLANVYVAGRCVSTDRAVQSSIRVMPGCFITGQAVGLAASLAIENDTDTRGVDVNELRHRLRELGAFLPE